MAFVQKFSEELEQCKENLGSLRQALIHVCSSHAPGAARAVVFQASAKCEAKASVCLLSADSGPQCCKLGML